MCICTHICIYIMELPILEGVRYFQILLEREKVLELWLQKESFPKEGINCKWGWSCFQWPK